MRKSVQEYVQKCDSCQRRKDDREFTAPLGVVEEPRALFVSPLWMSQGHMPRLREETDIF